MPVHDPGVERLTPRPVEGPGWTILSQYRIRELRDRIDIVRDCDLDVVHLAISTREARALLDAFEGRDRIVARLKAIRERLDQALKDAAGTEAQEHEY